MSQTIRLVHRADHVTTRACGTCRHSKGRYDEMWCAATGFTCRSERLYVGMGACREEGRLWEPKPPKIGAWGHLKRLWLGAPA